MTLNPNIGQDIRTMNPRELVRGLMRGHRPELKLGYDAPNAALAAVEAQKITNPFVACCVGMYAYGFAAGMIHRDDYNPYEIDASGTFVATAIEKLTAAGAEIPDDAARTLAQEFRDGVNAGSDEDPAKTYPAADG